ncbi:hypothetical protein F5Y05DRAFT_375558 [Hypoxylon sp. FL0543]|nr:hypothetical protein F5Y05DRAFT_375558 [Hypoxylon sp. FL0543]
MPSHLLAVKHVLIMLLFLSTISVFFYSLGGSACMPVMGCLRKGEYRVEAHPSYRWLRSFGMDKVGSGLIPMLQLVASEVLSRLV